MAGSVSIGSLSGTLAMRDEFSAQMAKFETRLKAIESSTQKTTKTTKTETDKINEAYKKVAASLDPVVANTQKYEKAEKALNDALKKGIITQDHHTKSLDRAKEKYLSASAHTLTWREEIHNLSGVIAPFASRLANVSVLIRDVTNAFNNSKKLASENISAFSSLTNIIKPFIPLLASVAIAAGVVYVGFKLIKAGVELVTDAIQSGLKTQLIIERLSGALQASGSASGLSSRQMVEYAESLELVTARSKEEIVAAETILSRFDSLGKDAFPKALDTTLAYAKAMGVTADVAAGKLGPAFEGSTRSLNALKEAGIVFTAGQRKTLTQMVEAGKITEYQALLFDILEEKVGKVSEGYDNNLSRQVGRAKIVLEDFGEGIATEVIPALEDLFSELIDLAGGWDMIKAVISSAGREIGDIIRTLVQSVIINYHEWSGEFDVLVAHISNGYSILMGVIADFAGMMSQVPMAGQELWTGIAVNAEKASDKMSDVATKAGNLAVKHGLAAAVAVKNLVAHRTALEGDEEAYKKLAETIVNSSKTSGAEKQISKILAEQTEQIRHQFELRELASKRQGMDSIVRFKEEQKINDEHEYRLSLLKLQAQFGTVIGKQLADQERMIKNLNRQVKFELSIPSELSPVNLTAKIDKDFATSMKDFTDEFKEIQKVAGDNAEALDEVGKAHEEWLQDFADGWKESFKSNRQIAEEEMEAVKEAVEEGLLTVAEGERAIAQIRNELLQETIEIVSAAGNFITQLGQITKSANVQKWGTFISQAGNAAQAANQFYTNPSVVSMFGAAGAWLGAFVTIAEMFTDKGGVHFGAEIGDVSGSAGVTDQWTFVKGQIDEARKAGNAIADVINDILLSLGAQLDDLANFVIEQKGEGWAVTFEDGLRRYFDDFEDALAFGVSQALASSDLSNITDEIRKALQENVFDTVDELQEFISFAVDYSRIGLSDLTNSLMDLTKNLIEGSRKAIEYGLGISKISDEFGKQIGSIRDKILGIVKSPQEQLKTNVVDFNNWITQQRLAAQIQQDSANAQMIAAKIQMDSARANAKMLGLDRDPEMTALFLEAQRIWKDAANRLDLWTKVLDNLPPLITPEEEAEAGKRLKGTGGGGGSRQQARDFIASRRFEMSLGGLTGYERSLAELDKQYDDLIKQAGKDKGLKQELLDLKKEEIALLEKEEKLRLAASFKEFVNPSSGFDKIRETAKGLMDEISKGPFGDERKARMIGRIFASLDAQLQAMSDEMVMGLFGELSSDLEKFGAEEEQLSSIRKSMAILEHTLKMVHYRQEIAMLIAEGKLSKENQKILEDGLAFLEKVDPNLFLNSGDSGGPTASGALYNAKMEAREEANKNLLDSIKKANDLLSKYTSDIRDSFTRDLIEIRDDFTEIRKVLGDTPLVLSTFNSAVKKAVDEFIKPVKDFREGRQLSNLSTLTGEQQFLESQSKFRSLFADIQAGDISKVSEIINMGQMYGELGQGFTAGSGLRFIMKELDDTMLSIERLIPNYAAGIIGAEGSVMLGSVSNPMNVQSSPATITAIGDTTAAINTGNSLVLTELRSSNTQLNLHTHHLKLINQTLSSTLTVRNIA